MLEFIVKTLDSKKAEEIEAIKVTDLTIIADYFVIASATSTTHVKSLADEVEFKMKEKGIYPNKIEGYSSATWILLDYSDIVVHIFTRDQREHYSLGKLWRDGERVDLTPWLV